jgi:hypothetical protein
MERWSGKRKTENIIVDNMDSSHFELIIGLNRMLAIAISILPMKAKLRELWVLSTQTTTVKSLARRNAG